MSLDHLEEDLRKVETYSFRLLDLIPKTSGIYAAWLCGEQRCFYVGKAGNLRRRIRSHFSGQRGSDQFCLYVYDSYVHYSRPTGLSTPEVNRLTRDWIRQRISFRCVELPQDEISGAESFLRERWKPLLNPL